MSRAGWLGLTLPTTPRTSALTQIRETKYPTGGATPYSDCVMELVDAVNVAMDNAAARELGGGEACG